MIKLIKPQNIARFALFSVLYACTTGSAYATTDSTVIEISHTYTPYVNFIGTAPGSARFYDNDDLVSTIIPIPVNLGTMGLESNVPGDCDVDFSTQNGFKLLHTINNNNLGDYSLLYRSQTFNATSNPQLTMPCTSAATNIDFMLTATISLVGADLFLVDGIYRDVVTVTVTTQ